MKTEPGDGSNMILLPVFPLPIPCLKPYPECCIYKLFAVLKIEFENFPGGKVGRNPPANAGDMSSIPFENFLVLCKFSHLLPDR